MIPVIDMHCDTISEVFKRNLGAEGFRNNSELHVDLERMKKGGYMCQNFAMYSCSDDYESFRMRPFEYISALSDFLDKCVESNSDYIRPALTAKDITDNFEKGYLSSFKTIEEGMVFEGNPDNVRACYDKGVRMSTITWNYENELGYPNPSGFVPGTGHYGCVGFDTVNGLKPMGFEVVKEMENLGMIIDISHLNDAGIEDVFNTVKPSTPIVASHSNARGVTMHPRNLSDAMLHKLADHGGITGINFAGAFLDEKNAEATTPSENYSRISDMVKHMQYIRNVAGIESIGLGSDLDGITGVLDICSADKMQSIADAMSLAGFTDDEIEKVYYKNALRVYAEILD